MEADADVENWFLLMDPSWEPQTEDEAPPLEAVVGLWPVKPDGGLGPFRTNPGYLPSNPDSPADPMDAMLRLVISGDAEVEQFQLLMRDSLFDIAMNGDDRPLVMRSPDDVPCVVIATSEVHRLRVSSPDWRRIDLVELVNMLADDVDVLFNPGGPASVRLVGDFMRRALALSDEEVGATYQRFHGGQSLEVLPWEVPPVPGGRTATAGEPEFATVAAATAEPEFVTTTEPAADESAPPTAVPRPEA
ncbi:type VII secretion system-associated protein [Saccharothrix yanglingensis]|uniref:type VII secretion system-associated protein n=1 Tax=Saccharothrix yanglingensis TaxID=659496 RepID=UPI0027D2D755|nr:type VII secretion system-associated protein [Saccharothrix yanglingensis]